MCCRETDIIIINSVCNSVLAVKIPVKQCSQFSPFALLGVSRIEIPRTLKDMQKRTILFRPPVYIAKSKVYHVKGFLQEP